MGGMNYPRGRTPTRKAQTSRGKLFSKRVETRLRCRIMGPQEKKASEKRGWGGESRDELDKPLLGEAPGNYRLCRGRRKPGKKKRSVLAVEGKKGKDSGRGRGLQEITNRKTEKQTHAKEGRYKSEVKTKGKRKEFISPGETIGMSYLPCRPRRQAG